MSKAVAAGYARGIPRETFFVDFHLSRMFEMQVLGTMHKYYVLLFTGLKTGILLDLDLDHGSVTDTAALFSHPKTAWS